MKEGAGDRKDLLARLQEGKDESGQPMGKDELTVRSLLAHLSQRAEGQEKAEALTQKIAGSDTTSNSSCAIVWWVVKHPAAHRALVKELDSKLAHVDDGCVDYDDCKDLPYLAACINESLRRHSTSSIGLPRIIVEDTEFKGRVLKRGTIASVPSYDIHHSEQVYGDPCVSPPFLRLF